MLVNTDEKPSGIWFILKGQLKVFRDKTHLMCTVNQGESCGDPEMNYMVGERDAVITTSEVFCFHLPAQNYENVLSVRANSILGERSQNLIDKFKVFEKWDSA